MIAVFPRVIKEYRHKVKCETGDFTCNLSDDDHDIHFGNESVCESNNAPSTKVNVSSNQNFQLPTWHGPFHAKCNAAFDASYATATSVVFPAVTLYLFWKSTSRLFKYAHGYGHVTFATLRTNSKQCKYNL